MVSRTAQAADLDALLGLYREVFSELTFRTDALDAQRAEVMREMADKRLGNDLSAGFIAAIAPGSLNDVLDAQNSEDVPHASVETIRPLYHRLCRPENTTVVIVGDVDASQLAVLIERRFGDWRGVGPAPARVDHARSWLPTISAREGSEWWRRQWHAGVEHLRVETPDLARAKNPQATIRASVGNADCKVGPS